ncbi:MAG: HhH-GPD-type base excision DNA repair protein [Actinomycetes bacterium]
MPSSSRRPLAITGDAAADALLDSDPFALLVGMLLDQQYPMEHAFAGPHKLTQRLGTGRLDPAAVAAYDPAEFATLCATPPAVHRYPGSMAGRIQSLASTIVDEYEGDAAAIWRDAGSGGDLLARLKALPGFGDAKARIFVALLGKQRGVQPSGWERAAGAYAETGSFRSVADVVDAASLAKVRAFKQEQKRAAKAQ